MECDTCQKDYFPSTSSTFQKSVCTVEYNHSWCAHTKIKNKIQIEVLKKPEVLSCCFALLRAGSLKAIWAVCNWGLMVLTCQRSIPLHYRHITAHHGWAYPTENKSGSLILTPSQYEAVMWYWVKKGWGQFLGGLGVGGITASDTRAPE